MDSDSDASSVDMAEFQALVRSQGAKKSYINNVEALQLKIQTLAESSGDQEHSMTCTVEADREEEAVDPHDDFKREEAFIRQAKAAIAVVLPRLAAAGVPINRPSDYYAEMVKSDEHMKKIKAKLLSEQQSLEQSEKARKQRELKKFGKKVQHEVLEKRRKEKRDALDTVKKIKSKSRQARDEKYGFGPKSRGGGAGAMRGGRGGRGGRGRGGFSGGVGIRGGGGSASAGGDGGGAGAGRNNKGKGKGKPQQKKRPGLSKRKAGRK